MLEIERIHTYYGDSHVLHDVTLEVRAGEAVALLGRNGVGKTTLIRSVVGFTPPRAGEIRFDGHAIHHLPAHAVARRGIALVPQGRRIFAPLTVEENLTIGLRRRTPSFPAHPRSEPGSPSPRQQISPSPLQQTSPSPRHHISPSPLQQIYDIFPRLRERARQGGGTLSGGEQQMLAVARALMTDPRLLVLDEPSEGLAPLIVREIGRVLTRLKSQGLSILLVEQNVPLALRVADRAYVMSKGQIVYHGRTSELAANEDVKRRFLGVS
jgi:branched-chain amino acid transport system ATP-binding protein